jgi:hypothetical protein
MGRNKRRKLAWDIIQDEEKAVITARSVNNDDLINMVAEILRSQPAKQFVTCHFEYNQINDEGILALMQFLTNQPIQVNLQLRLEDNLITPRGYQYIFDAYKLGRFSQEFRIEVCPLSNALWHSKLNSLIIRNALRSQATLRCLTFLLGTREDKLPMKRLCRDILILILSYSYPCQRSLLATGQLEKDYFARRTFAFFRSLNPGLVIASEARQSSP